MDLFLNIIASIGLWFSRRYFYFYGSFYALKNREFMKYQRDIALAKDAYGNCLGKYYFNNRFGEGFGNRKETISSRLGKNKQNNTLKPKGFFWYNFLNKRQANHCENAIDNVI